jgi:hypothetical protein
VLQRLPLGRTDPPAPFISVIEEAGWTRIRISRLRDVEWSVEAHYALIADA